MTGSGKTGLCIDLIEEAVKEWVNVKRYWVKYEVKIVVGNYDLGLGIADNYVNSTLTAEASVLNTQLKPVAGLTRKVEVESTFRQPAGHDLKITENATKLANQTARPEDLKIDVLGTSRQTDGQTVPMFSDALEVAMKATINRMGKERLASELTARTGWGPVYNAVLWKAYELIKRRADKTLPEFDADEARNFRAMQTRWKSEADKLIHD